MDYIMMLMMKTLGARYVGALMSSISKGFKEGINKFLFFFDGFTSLNK